MITLFREQEEKHGDKVALSDPSTSKSVTYGQLDENARRIAAKLISDGLKHGEPVLIIASRSIGFVEAILGILMEGGAYVPLSDHYPADRTEFIRKIPTCTVLLISISIICKRLNKGICQSGEPAIWKFENPILPF